MLQFLKAIVTSRYSQDIFRVSAVKETSGFNISLLCSSTNTRALLVNKPTNKQATGMMTVARRPLENILTLTGTGFAYRNVGILHYSRRHDIGDLRRPALA